MSILIAIVLSSLVTWTLCRIMRHHAIADLQTLHKKDLDAVMDKSFLRGWEDCKAHTKMLDTLKKTPYVKP